MYFDLVALTDLTITSLEVHLGDGNAGASIRVWRRDGTVINKEGTTTGWSEVANGAIPSPQSLGTLSTAVLDNPIPLQVGRHGIAIEYFGDELRYYDGLFPLGRLATSNADLELYEGSVGTQLFNGRCCAPRVWSGTVNYELGASGPVGMNYCTPLQNSTGQPAIISGFGSNVAADNDLVLSATSLPVGSFSFFLTSQSTGFVVGPGGSQGVLCLGGSIGRYVGPGQVQQASAAGNIELALDLTMMPQPNGFAQAMAGQSWYFQAWYRDTDNGTPTSNFTDGLQVSFR